MNTRPFDGECVFVRAILAAGRTAGAAPEGGRSALLLADADQLAELCALCFWASLEVEESREVRGTVCICSPGQVRLVRAFGEPVPLTVENLVALLTASPRSPLAVHGGPEGLAAWGLLDVEPAGLVRLRLAGNGILLASRARRVLAILHHGSMAIPAAADEESLTRLVARTLGKERALEEREGLIIWLIHVVASMIRLGHGGTLLLVEPEDASWRASVRLRFRFDAPSANLLHDSLQDFHSGMAGALRDYRALLAGRGVGVSVRSLRERYDAVNSLHSLNEALFRRVGDLSLIDGAVVMDLDLRLHGFGAKLLYGPDDFPVTTLNAVTGTTSPGVRIDDLGGMRHQSAARFVNANHACDVLVVSQDGRLSYTTWSEALGGLAVVQNLEHFLWEYRTF